jgi:hypothetical protein
MLPQSRFFHPIDPTSLDQVAALRPTTRPATETFETCGENPDRRFQRSGQARLLRDGAESVQDSAVDQVRLVGSLPPRHTDNSARRSRSARGKRSKRAGPVVGKQGGSTPSPRPGPPRAIDRGLPDRGDRGEWFCGPPETPRPVARCLPGPRHGEGGGAVRADARGVR